MEPPNIQPAQKVLETFSHSVSETIAILQLARILGRITQLNMFTPDCTCIMPKPYTRSSIIVHMALELAFRRLSQATCDIDMEYFSANSRASPVDTCGSCSWLKGSIAAQTESYFISHCTAESQGLQALVHDLARKRSTWVKAFAL